MRYETAVTIDASPQTIWTVLVDIESWPDMTPSIKRVERLDDGPLAVGSRARVHQPRLPAAIWTVTELEPPTSFIWEARTPGATTVAGHIITASNPNGPATVRFTLDQTGPLAPLLSLFTGRLSRSYVDLEARGLKTQTESP